MFTEFIMFVEVLFYLPAFTFLLNIIINLTYTQIQCICFFSLSLNNAILTQCNLFSGKYGNLLFEMNVLSCKFVQL